MSTRQAILISLGALSLLLSGCVSRTTSSDPSLSDMQRGIGYDAGDKVVTQKTVWIWQSDFWNP